MRGTINISNIKIDEDFVKCPPSSRKIQLKREKMEALGRQNKPITLDSHWMLTDGYATLLAMKELGYTECECVIKDNTYGNYEKNIVLSYRNKPTVYIYGIHKGTAQNPPKEYVWRVPTSRKEFVEKNVLPGDTVICNTRYGNKPVVVTKIETLDKCPVEQRVLKFICKIDDGE